MKLQVQIDYTLLLCYMEAIAIAKTPFTSCQNRFAERNSVRLSKEATGLSRSLRTAIYRRLSPENSRHCLSPEFCLIGTAFG